MLLATWNLNHRVGKRRFKLEAAHAAVELGADVMIFTEYFPDKHPDKHKEFCRILADGGWGHQFLSLPPEKPAEVANRVLIASRLLLEREPIVLPDFDFQFPANMAAITLPTVGIRILGIRIPAYGWKDRDCLAKSWDWLESTAATWRNTASVIIGDLNVRPITTPGKRNKHFKRIQTAGWTRPQPKGSFSFCGDNGPPSEIDHVLVTNQCFAHNAVYMTEVGSYVLACAANSLSDHTALVVEVNLT